jgi:hypothetical protein
MAALRRGRPAGAVRRRQSRASLAQVLILPRARVAGMLLIWPRAWHAGPRRLRPMPTGSRAIEAHAAGLPCLARLPGRRGRAGIPDGAVRAHRGSRRPLAILGSGYMLAIVTLRRRATRCGPARLRRRAGWRSGLDRRRTSRTIRRGALRMRRGGSAHQSRRRGARLLCCVGLFLDLRLAWAARPTLLHLAGWRWSCAHRGGGTVERRGLGWCGSSLQRFLLLSGRGGRCGAGAARGAPPAAAPASVGRLSSFRCRCLRAMRRIGGIRRVERGDKLRLGHRAGGFLRLAGSSAASRHAARYGWFLIFRHIGLLSDGWRAAARLANIGRQLASTLTFRR